MSASAGDIAHLLNLSSADRSAFAEVIADFFSEDVGSPEIELETGN